MPAWIESRNPHGIACISSDCFCWSPASKKSAGADAPPLYIEGYTDRLSYLPGEEVSLHISTPAGKLNDWENEGYCSP